MININKIIDSKTTQRFFILSLTLFLLLSCAFSALAAPPASSEVLTRKIVMDAVKNYVKGSGNGASMKVLGSWVGDNKRYKDPLKFSQEFSDHDMTLVMPAGSDSSTMLSEWKKSRKSIADQIRKTLTAQGRSNKEIKRAIESVSIYPPQQLVDSALTGSSGSAKDVKKLFMTIDHGKPLPPNLAEKEIEGIFGTGSKAFRQAYERQAGQTIYKMGNKVRVGFTDLNHMIEGYGRFTLKGSTNISSQFAAKIIEAIEEGKGKDAGKNLGRLAQYLKKTKSLARVSPSVPDNPTMEALLKNFSEVEAKVKQIPVTKQTEKQISKLYNSWLKKNSRQLKQVINSTKIELGLYRQLAATMNPDEVSLIYQLLERKSSPWRRFMDKLTKSAQKGTLKVASLPWKKIIHGLNALMIAAEANDVVDVWKKKGLNAAFNHGAMRAILFKLNLPSYLTKAMLESALEQTKENGYGLLASYQQCDQLVSGIYMVKGREQVAEGMDIPAMARNLINQDDVLAVVRKHAEQAASRHLISSVEKEVEGGITQALMNRCGPWVIRAWQRQRMQMLGSLFDAKNKVDLLMGRSIMDMNASTRPVKDENKVAVFISVAPSQGRAKILKALKQLSDGIQLMGGKEKLGILKLSESYTWLVDDKPVASGNMDFDVSGSASLLLDPNVNRRFVFNKPSKHRISLRYRLSMSPGLIPAQDLFAVRSNLSEAYHFQSMIEFDDTNSNLKEMPQTRTLVLRVFAEKDKSKSQIPISNTKIRLQDESRSITPTQIKPGNYQVKKLTPGKYDLSIQADGYISKSIPLSIPKADKNTPPLTRTVYLSPATGTITLKIIDDQGKPIPSADVALLSKHWKSGEPRVVNVAGQLTFKDVPSGTYRILAEAPGFQPLLGTSTLKINPMVKASGSVKRITLNPYLSTVKIMVSDPFSQPVADALVSFANLKGSTDSRGQVSFDSVRPSGGLVPYKVTTKKEAYATSVTSLEVSPSRNNQEITHKITLQGGIPLDVKIIDADSGKPLPGSSVQISYGDKQITAASNSNGVARFNNLPPEFVYINASLPGYQPVSNKEKDLRFAIAGKQQRITIKLSEGMSIKVYVKDDKGELLASSFVSMDDGPFWEAPTGSHVFEGVKKGRHLFRGRARKFAEALVFYEAEPRKKQRDAISLQLLPGATIMVEVRNQRGEIIRKTPTKITLYKNDKPLKTVSGPLKLFANLEAGVYRASASAKGYNSGNSREIRYDGDPLAFHAPLPIKLNPDVLLSTLRVAVSAIDENGNPKMAPAKIQVHGPGGDLTENDLIGNFPDLIPGKYTVTASVQGFGSQTKTVIIAAKQARKIYTLTFKLTKNKQADKTKAVPTLNCCHKDTDDCITNNILTVLKYCRELCRGKPHISDCFQKCRQNTHCSDGREQPWTPPPAPDTMRKIPKNNNNQQHEDEPDSGSSLKALQQKFKLLGEKLKSAKTSKDAAKIRQEMMTISNRINSLLLHSP